MFITPILRKRIVLILALIISIASTLYGQTTTYNTSIKKADTVSINNSNVDIKNAEKVNLSLQFNAPNCVELAEPLKVQLMNNLKLLYSKYQSPPSIYIEFESGNSSRYKAASEIYKYLKFCKNVSLEDPSNIIMGKYPNHPITISMNPKDTTFAKDLVKSLSPFITGTYGADLDSLDNPNEIEFYIYGTPSYNQYGQVTIE